MRAVVVITISLIALLYCGIPMFMHPTTAVSGIAFRPSKGLYQPNFIDVARNSPAYRAGLRSGDIISCLSMRDSNLLAGSAYVPGTPIHLCVTHNGVPRPVQFVATTGPPLPSSYGSDGLAALRLAGYALFVLCAIVLVLGRPGLMTWLFFAYTIAGVPTVPAASVFTLYSATFYAFQDILNSAITFGGGATLIAFAILVPDDVAPPGWRRPALAIAYALIAVMAAVGVVYWCVTAVSFSLAIPTDTSIVITLLVIIAVLTRLATTKRGERARFGWAAFAIMWTVIIDMFRLNGGILGTAAGPGIMSLFAIVTPAVLLYAVLKRHVIDIRFAVSRTLVFAIITTFVIAIIGAVDWATSAYLHEVKVAMALDAVATICVAFALNRVHHWVERIVDVALFRQKYAAEEYLNRLGPTLLEAQREETVHAELARAPVRALKLTMSAVFRMSDPAYVLCASAGSDPQIPPGFDRDHEMVRFLTTARSVVRLDSIAYESRAELAIPIFQGKRLTGFVLYGAHTDGTHLDPDEVDALRRFCDAAAQAYISITYERYNAVAQPALA